MSPCTNEAAKQDEEVARLNGMTALERVRLQLHQALADATRRAIEAERDLAEALATAERFRERFRRAETAIARARKFLRRPNLSVPMAYLELDWRRRR